MGLALYIPEKNRLNSVVSIRNPEGVNFDDIRTVMVKQFGVEISGAFGLDIIRIGQMGEQCRSTNLFKTLYALGMSFKVKGISLDVANGMAQLETNMTKDMENIVE